MQPQSSILAAYNQAARAYADKFGDELSGKHFDRLLLNAFADETKGTGTLLDLGCGPGQTTAFLHRCGVAAITGTDLSPEMIKTAQHLHPQLRFEVADMLSLHYANNTFSAAVAFYAVVHFTSDQLKTAFAEVGRVLKPEGQFLFSFHIGSNAVRVENFLGSEAALDFYFFETENVKKLLADTGFETVDVVEREPYEGVEYPSRRAYVWARKPKE